MIRVCLALLLWSGAAQALTLDLPAPAERTATATETGVATFPSGPWRDGGAPIERAEGALDRTAWRLPGVDRSVQSVLSPARDALIASGSKVVFECADTACGGYDFRFQLELLPPPAMFVDLGDYRYALLRAADRTLVALVASRAADAGYLHVTEVRPSGVASADPVAVVPTAEDAGPVWDALQRNGRAALDDLVFATGAATLEGGPFASLASLAKGLNDRPEARVALVGHSDTTGGLEANIAVSRRRAQAVRQALIDTYDVSPGQLDAEGVAYLAPRAPNGDDAGRRANRRVEAVLITP